MIFNELKQHGTEDFPFELYRMKEGHHKYYMAYHWHTNLELVRVLKGSLALHLDNREHLLHEKDVAIINSETVHGAIPTDCEYECIVFNLAFLKTGNDDCDAFIDNLLSRSNFIHERPQAESVVSLVHSVFDALGSNVLGSHFKVIGLLQQTLGEIQQKNDFISHLPPSSVQDEQKTVKLKAALKYMRENFDQDLTLEDMATAAGFSSKYFCKFFKELTGSTPVSYLTDYRIERAARKLLGSDMTVTQIAYACGFNDLSYFIKTFKAQKGVSPKEYRKR